ncbi:MAG TPA: sodium:solute symporter family protein [Phycisphaerae bacterium]|nr:sodium:solute symporter family protein [Phycisphaerae bacterium]
MLLGQTVGLPEVIAVVVYLGIVAYLGWLGYRRTHTATDYLVAGRKAHPFIMAMSYGATFISTSAIVGFGGAAGLFGMSVLWLTFLNIFVGIFIAFAFLGGPARRLGHALDAHTFPELLGRRFDSRVIQVFAGLIIFLFMPLYAAAVIIGGTEFVTTAFGVDYHAALLVLSVIVAVYVLAGGLKSVMYTDALQGTIMFAGMVLLLLFTYGRLGGVTEAHRSLTQLADLVPRKLADMGHRGWTAMPAFGFGDRKYDLWWIVVSTITLGVGIGVLAQPQLVVRFMTVKSRRELNRAVPTGGLFILCMTGVAFTVGSLSNAYFVRYGPPLTGRVVKVISAEKGHAILQVMQKDEQGRWVDVPDKLAPVVLEEPAAARAGLAAAAPVRGRSVSIVYAKGNPDQIIPTYITSALPKWFGVVFLLTLLAAAMSTISSQFHTVGTAIGRDVIEQLLPLRTDGHSGRTIHVVRIGMIVGIIMAVTFAYYARGGYIVARATAIFFGLCAATFLPSFVGGLFFRRMTRAGAVASMITGAILSTFWVVFVKAQEAGAIGLVQKLTGGKTSILEDHPNWPVIEPIVVALPLSILVAIVVSLATRPPAEAHLNRCFRA